MELERAEVAETHTHTHTHLGAGSLVHTLTTYTHFSLYTGRLIYGKCECQFHDPATVLHVRPLIH